MTWKECAGIPLFITMTADHIIVSQMSKCRLFGFIFFFSSAQKHFFQCTEFACVVRNLILTCKITIPFGTKFSAEYSLMAVDHVQ